MYQAITEEDRAEIEDDLYNQMLKDSWEERKEKHEEYLVCYCTVQNTSFVSGITTDELKVATKLVIDILEELKKLNNAGLNKEKFKKLFKQYITKEDDIDGYFKLWDKAFNVEKLYYLFFVADKIRRVGGAYAAIIAHPKLTQLIIAVYDVLVDSFDDEDLYWTCAYFLLRGIMWINSSES